MTHVDTSGCIAVVGMSGRFPAASSIDEFWANLRTGRDCFTDFSISDIVEAGLPRQLAEAPTYVRRCPVVRDSLALNPRALGCTAEEAARIDPQHRMLALCAGEALKDAGYDPSRFDGSIGIWAGSAFQDYSLRGMLARFGPFEGLPDLDTHDPKDSLCGLVARRFNLRGPAVVVQSACSTSLVAVHLACEALRTYRCDMALAGGVSLQYTRLPGYMFMDGEILSPDGFCRTFDKGANGTVFGEGCGVVVLRRLDDAAASGDTVFAVVRGSAVNNDGATRAGFTAPGVAGQAELLAMAHAAAGIQPDEISYVEAHGTGTPLGDQIELAALTEVFRLSTEEREFCGLGATKTSIGHLDAAAGVAGLIKTVCALRHRQMPAVQNFAEPNPELKLPTSPFFVVDALMDWMPRRERRLAGVSSFGLGGTNAHVVLEEFTPPLRRCIVRL
jgi:phthiocerol/phenolphthiocerol synthesis type-I polyketide synthase E